MNDNYHLVGGKESGGSHGYFGVRILLQDAPPYSDAVQNAVRDAIEKIEEVVLTERISKDPKAQEAAKQQKEELLGLFAGHVIRAVPIPNGYCSKYCCKHLPWFRVTTYKGDITVGWRKRVIEVSWEEGIAPLAKDLFPNENVTKGGCMIHAWSLEDARRYVQTILQKGYTHENK